MAMRLQADIEAPKKFWQILDKNGINVRVIISETDDQNVYKLELKHETGITGKGA